MRLCGTAPELACPREFPIRHAAIDAEFPLRKRVRTGVRTAPPRAPATFAKKRPELPVPARCSRTARQGRAVFSLGCRSFHRARRPSALALAPRPAPRPALAPPPGPVLQGSSEAWARRLRLERRTTRRKTMQCKPRREVTLVAFR